MYRTVRIWTTCFPTKVDRKVTGDGRQNLAFWWQVRDGWLGQARCPAAGGMQKEQLHSPRGPALCFRMRLQAVGIWVAAGAFAPLSQTCCIFYIKNPQWGLPLGQHTGQAGAQEHWCPEPALSQRRLGLEVSPPTSWPLPAGGTAPRLFYFTSQIAPPPGLRPCHWQQSPAPYALLIASFPSLSHFPSPPVAYLDHLHTQPFTPQILVTGTASGEAETGSERGGVGLPGVRLCPKSWGPRYQARVRGGDWWWWR